MVIPYMKRWAIWDICIYWGKRSARFNIQALSLNVNQHIPIYIGFEVLSNVLLAPRIDFNRE